MTVPLAIAGGIALKWLLEKLLNVVAGDKKDSSLEALLSIAKHEQSKEAFERHVIETLAKMTILLDEITRRIGK